MDDPTITEIQGHDAALVAALAQAGLPVDDLAEPGRRFFRFSDGHGPIGYVGWEKSGDTALLRSLAVLPARRGQGWGRAMIGWALLSLAEGGATDAYLLTTSMDRLAARLGFAAIPRAEAPPAVRSSRQAASLCPSTAILMHRSLP